jgi:anti-sigma B factor antagonist
MDFAVDHRLTGKLTIVTVSGELDVFTSPRLRETLLDVVEGGALHLIVDLSGVEFLDSTGLGVLVGIHHRLQAHDGTMSFVGASERLRRVFHITRLDKLFTIHPTLDDALRHAAGDSVEPPASAGT